MIKEHVWFICPDPDCDEKAENIEDIEYHLRKEHSTDNLVWIIRKQNLVKTEPKKEEDKKNFDVKFSFVFSCKEFDRSDAVKTTKAELMDSIYRQSIMKHLDGVATRESDNNPAFWWAYKDDE